MLTRQSLPLALALIAGIGFLPSALADGAHGSDGQASVQAIAAQDSHPAWSVGGNAPESLVAVASTSVATGSTTKAVRSRRAIVSGLELYMHAPR